MKDRLIYLVNRFTSKTITAEEAIELQEMLNRQDDSALVEAGAEAWLNEPLPEFSLEEHEVQIRKNLTIILGTDKTERTAEEPAPAQSYPMPVHRVHFFRRRWGWAAAAVVLISTATWLLLKEDKKQQELAENNSNKNFNVTPGGDKAILTLADGSTIVLDSVANGSIGLQGNSSIVKLSNGEIVYQPLDSDDDRTVLNTMSTPRGGEYQLTLPDGTRVWLNAASSITFPSTFSGKERKIIIRGEVYMEVASNKEKPFLVDIDGRSNIEVLGTQFNVNSYSNESAIKTTLVSGSVRVASKGRNVLLKPGQQAVSLASGSGPVINGNVNIAQVLAWKNGMFDVNNVSFQEVARQLERWYDIEVKYEGSIPDLKFEGKLSRDLELSQIIQILEKVEIKFRLEGRTLIVYSPEKK